MKREFIAMQELGEKLIDLTTDQLNSIGLDESLLAAVLDARTIKSHGALRRQKQLIGKLMRETDPQPIREALDRFSQQDRVDKDQFKRAESWRDRIVNEGAPALAEFSEATGSASRKLQSLVKSLQATAGESGRRRIRRQIFREIHRQLSGGMQSDTD